MELLWTELLLLSGAPGTSPLEQRGCPGSTCTPGASGPRTSWFLVVRDFPAPDPVYHSYFYLLTTPPGARPVPILEQKYYWCSSGGSHPHRLVLARAEPACEGTRVRVSPGRGWFYAARNRSAGPSLDQEGSQSWVGGWLGGWLAGWVFQLELCLKEYGV